MSTKNRIGTAHGSTRAHHEALVTWPEKVTCCASRSASREVSSMPGIRCVETCGPGSFLAGSGLSVAMNSCSSIPTSDTLPERTWYKNSLYEICFGFGALEENCDESQSVPKTSV